MKALLLLNDRRRRGSRARDSEYEEKQRGRVFFCEKEYVGVQVWETLMTKINGAKGQLSKGDIVMLRDKLIAGCKAGHPCIDPDAA